MVCRVCILLALIVFCFFGTALSQDRYSSVRIPLADESELIKVLSLGFEPIALTQDYVDVIATTADLNRIQSSGVTYSVLVEDLTAFYRSRLDPSRKMGGYRTLSEIGLVLDSISTAHPDIVTVKSSIGTTIEGRPVWVIKISDNPTIDESEPEVYYYAAAHAREVITPEVLIYFMRYLTNNYGTDSLVTDIVNNRELFFSPCLNPDGYYYNEYTTPEGGGMWRKNRRDNGDGSFGVDLNRNYDWMWGFDDVGSSPLGTSETYRGTAPFSEPETQGVRDFVNSRQFSIAVDLHSAAGLLLYPWGTGPTECPDRSILASLADTAEAMTGYIPGPPWRVLYRVNGNGGDWTYAGQSTGRKTFVINPEVGTQAEDGFWPPRWRITPLVQLMLQPNLFFARIAGSAEKLIPPVAPTIYNIGDVDTTFFQLSWHHSDPYNPAVSYEVWQLRNRTRILDDFEGAELHWIPNGFTVSSHTHSGTHSYYSGDGNNLDAKLTLSDPIHVVSGDTLQFWADWTAERYYDFCYVEVSQDGGSTWLSIPGNVGSLTGNYRNRGYGFDWYSGGWVLCKFPLDAYVGQNVLLRFRYNTNATNYYGGLYIDDVTPVEFYTTRTKLAENLTDTTLLVENLEVGDYDYQVRALDAENQYSALSLAVTANVSDNHCQWLVGDADNSGSIDISDAVYLISFIFAGGAAPVPDPIGSGDADCSMSVDISDAVYMISYIFSGGPAPGNTCDCTNY